MERVYTRMRVAAKNQDTREHDIVDSDDYFQYHGGMVAAVRALTGESPEAYVGDSAVPDTVKTRTLQEETHRVFRARVVNPKWVSAMQRHGYKGAFEMAATVDYLFGYDATAGVVDDWMYEKLASAYVFDETNRAFMQKSNPWALRGISERLLEEGVFVTGFGFPVVPEGTARVRVQMTAAATDEHLDRAVAAFESVGRSAGLKNSFQHAS